MTVIVLDENSKRIQSVAMQADASSLQDQAASIKHTKVDSIKGAIRVNILE